MRLSKTLAAGAVALSALVTLTGCGDDGGEAASGPLSNLPKASTMADVQKAVVERGVSCDQLRKSSQENDYMEDEAKDPAWGIQERALCQDGAGRWVTMLLIGDMAKFQGALAKGSGSFSVGQNFAISAVSDYAGQSLVQNGLLVLSCNPDRREKVPSGFEIHEGLVKGCFTTNYDL
ncbi:hypothetical protein [Streptomyces vilmorinianum]|uniref:hypothetical protein n=1 Tax=Streptomyces vilmorinianum TaxID=3051092 RepID=UPI0010FB05DC|nr:hypothetical protein [Streptomyces vilmorinianum]